MPVEVLPRFCNGCEVPITCTDTNALRSASLVIRCALKGKSTVIEQLPEAGFTNEQLVAMVQCINRHTFGKCDEPA